MNKQMTYTKELTYGEYTLTVTYDVARLNIHVENSYVVKCKKDIRMLLEEIRLYEEAWTAMVENGYKRTVTSLVCEWAAHNRLYNAGEQPERTKDVDLDQGESRFRLFCYWVISLFFPSACGKSKKKISTSQDEIKETETKEEVKE